MPDQVLVTTGATQAIVLATRLFVRPGACVVIESPPLWGRLQLRLRGVGLLSLFGQLSRREG
ncbi:hypothetical protein [Embleya sp. MST-111070]|uniref:hypothetical protein n=1 Tax=Embleya sp. MST-111070 TaxID=3398231 RepID=UPI003F734B84